MLLAQAHGQGTTFVNDTAIGDPALIPSTVNTLINRGYILLSTTLPFETMDTLVYSNLAGSTLGSGRMEATPGFRFDYLPSTGGPRRWSSTFFSDNNARVQANDGAQESLLPRAIVGPSILSILATNIIVKSGAPDEQVPGSRASLVVGANGWLQLQGRNVDLYRSGLEVLPVWNEAVGSANDIQNNAFDPDIAVYDTAAVEGNFGQNPNTLASGSLWNGTTATSIAAPPSGAATVASFTLDDPESDYYIAVNPLSAGGVVLTNFLPDFNDPNGFVETDSEIVLVTNLVILPATYFDTNDVFTTNFVSLNITNGLTGGGNPAGDIQIVAPVEHTFELTQLTNEVVLTNLVVSGNVFAVQQRLTQLTIYTNITKGAVFGQAPPGFTIAHGFSGNNPRSVELGISAPISNAVTVLDDTASIYVQSTLASSGDRGLLVNSLSATRPPDAGTGRPASMVVSRDVYTGSTIDNPPPADFFVSSGILDPQNLDFGISDGILMPQWINRDSVSNATVTAGEYAAYEAFFDNIVSRGLGLPSETYTNLPGRVHIDAGYLDLRDTRIRAEGNIKISTPHLVSSTNTVIDCEKLGLDIGSTNGTLRVQGMAKDTVERLRGDITVWSGLWENTVFVFFGNNFALTNGNITMDLPNPDPEGDPLQITNVVLIPLTVTNTIAVTYHTMMVDARALTTTLPVDVYELKTHSPNVIIDDNMSLVETLIIDAQRLTLNTNFILLGGFPADPSPAAVTPTAPALENWGVTNAPNLAYFTNNALFFIPFEGHFGDDRAIPYTAFVNNGTVDTYSMKLKSRYYENSGDLLTYGILTLDGEIGRLLEGNTSSGGDTWLRGQNLSLEGASISAEGAVNIAISNNLSDKATELSSGIVARNGINLLVKPVTGDLLQSMVTSYAPEVPAPQPVHTWAGEDRGPSPAGFINNAAIGWFTLAPPDAGFSPVFFFRPAGARNAMYVDMLDLSGLTDINKQLNILPGMTIYYAAAMLGFTPPDDANGDPQTPEEYLNGKFNGRLRWVPTYAGANSSTTVNDVPLNAAYVTSLINRGLDPAAEIQVAPISIFVNGAGTVVAATNGTPLVVGQTYTLSAQPAEGATFFGWTGSVETNSRVIQFVMEPGLELTANFTFNPIDATYVGLFYEDDAVRFLQSGAITITTTKSGKLSGAVQVASGKYPFSTSLDDSGVAEIYVPRTAMFLTLQVGTNQITGIVEGDGWTANIFADRAGMGASRFAGNYTVVLPGSGDISMTGLPFGDGYAIAKVDASGKAKISGVLGDGTKFSQSASVTEDGVWPLFVPLYKGNGQLLSWIQLGNNPGEDLGGDFTWFKDEIGGKNYPDGFNLSRHAMGSLFSPTNAPLTGFSDAKIFFEGTGLQSSMLSELLIDSANKISNLGNTKLKLQLNKKQGLFKGSIADPVTGDKAKFQGVILQKQRFGSGFFLNGEETGRVRLEPAP